MTPLVIAIDGPAAAGKGTLARRLAAALEIPHLDTGLLYRAVGRRVLDASGDPGDVAVAEQAALALVAGDLMRTDLRGPAADAAASAVARHPGVRAALLAFQRRFPGQAGAVLDGRDIGTVVFPDATVKLFVTAAPEARARRRWQELKEAVPLADIESDMRDRDLRDSTRGTAPLRRADDAVLIDTTALDADAAFGLAMETVRRAVELSDPSFAGLF
ncbi:MAG: (d)CMP kinase [Janthinobacterium lividum]